MCQFLDPPEDGWVQSLTKGVLIPWSVSEDKWVQSLIKDGRVQSLTKGVPIPWSTSGRASQLLIAHVLT